jgi:hypothetical protein
MSLSNEYKKLITEKTKVEECIAIVHETLGILSKLLEKFDEYNINFNFDGTELCFNKNSGKKAKISINNTNFEPNDISYMLTAFSTGSIFNNVSLDDMFHIFNNLNHIFVTVTNEIGTALSKKVLGYTEELSSFIVKGLV